MNFGYDSWNRIMGMTYPDGEMVTYDYNLGGMLEQVTGDKGSEHNEYLHYIEYNTFEQKETVYYGNGTVTDYSYDVLLRLSHLRSVCADGTMQDIDYTYDEVSNISKIVNYASMLPTGLGGTYGSDYTYDNLYRLAYADGNWHGNNTLYYETSLEYEKNGRISRKVLYADTWLDGNYATENYDNRYYYANSSQPNTLSYINDTPQQSFGWDQKGNMVFHHNGHSGYDRKLCWDEQNRLLGVKDEGKLLSYYLYDANGDRTYKFTGEYAAQNQSGQWHYYYLLNCPTLYASPYLVTNKKGYTKHYYAESERIASRIGGGGLYDLHKGFENYPDMVSSHKESSANLFGKVMDCLDADALPQEDALKYLYEWQEFVEDEKDCYWYHPDHLGSSSWITYSDGKAVQHLHYLPWGEDFVDQRTSSFSSMYTFSAKEKDAETGYSYFGSRYYSSDLSIWLSVDPMSDKYPHQSNYVYCSNNPIKLIDPNGEDEWELSRDGYLTKRENGRTDVDIVYATDKNGKEISRYYKAGAINQNPDDYPGELILDDNDPSKKIDFTTHIMSFTNANVATDFFEFAAENTDVEWALNIGEAETIVGTSHQDDFNQVRSPQNVKYQIHSHWSYRHILSSRGPDGTPCSTCDIPMMINNPNTYKVYEAFKRRYVSMDDQKNYRYEISKNIQKSINLFQTTHRLWFK